MVRGMFDPNRYKKVNEKELGMACPTPLLKKAKEVPLPSLSPTPFKKCTV